MYFIFLYLILCQLNQSADIKNIPIKLEERIRKEAKLILNKINRIILKNKYQLIEEITNGDNFIIILNLDNY